MWPFRKPKPVLITPAQRMRNALAEFNAALDELNDEERFPRFRPWVRSGDHVRKTRPVLMVGYWCRDGDCFVPVYGGP